MAAPKVGNKAPSFKLTDADGNTVSLSDFKGKKVMGIERSTFIIDEKEKLVEEIRKVKVDGHIDHVLNIVKSI